ncbi:DUF4421 family protein [Chitinophagaceae bacterium MMS25-I14]
MKRIVFFLLNIWMVTVCSTVKCTAQKTFLGKMLQVCYDSTCVSPHDDDLTVRPYTERNFNSYKLIDRSYRNKIIYRPNTPLIAGIGLSYRIIGVNLGFIAPYVNRYDKYGKSKFFDLSTHFYLRKWIVDMYWQEYRGQYIPDPQRVLNNWNSSQGVPIQPGMTTKARGVFIQYIQNAAHFSLEAPFAQVQYQKRAAGSFIFGGGFNIQGATGDSSFIPRDVQYPGFFDGFRFNKAEIYSLTANAGYAYSLIFHQHWFVTGMLQAGGGINYTSLKNDNTQQEFSKRGPQLDINIRAAAGYNSEYYFAGIQYINYIARCSAPIEGMSQEFNISNLHLTVARRFKLKKRLLGFY